MNKKLEEINKIFLKVQDYIDPQLDVEGVPNLNPEKGQEFSQGVRAHTPHYLKAVAMLDEVADQLTPLEIIEGFQEGCRLLQRGLSGLMFRKFHYSYVPVMVNSVMNNDDHVTFLFIRSLSKNLLQDKAKIGDLAIRMLNRPWPLTRQAALSVIYELGILDAYPKVLPLINDPDPEVSSIANTIISSWEKKE